MGFDQSATDEITGQNISPSSVSTDNLVDGGGISHTGRIADVGELLLATYKKTVGKGSITNNSGFVEIREPGNASAAESSRLYSHIIDFDPSKRGKITIQLSNITIDTSSEARIELSIGDVIDTNNAGDDELRTSVRGSGDILAITSENTSTSFTSDTSQDNAYISALDTLSISWDGSQLTVTADDGSTQISVSESGSYPSGETLHLKIAAVDNSPSTARQAGFDLNAVEVEQ